MFSRSSLRIFFRQKKVSIKQYLSPDFYCPEMQNYELLYQREDLGFEAITQGLELKDISDGAVLNPPGLRFGMNKKEVIKKLGKPYLIVDNSSNVRDHQILLYKRRLGKFNATTQVHFNGGKLRLVVDEFSKVFIPNVNFLNQIAAGIGLSSLDMESSANNMYLFQDQRGNVLKAEEGISIMFLWLSR